MMMQLTACWTDLFNICLYNDDVQDCDTRWAQILLGTSEIPQEDVLGCLYKMKLQGSEQLTSSRVGYVQPWFESRWSNAELSKIEDHGKTTYWSDDQEARLRSLEWKNWDGSMGQKSWREKASASREKWENAYSGKQQDSVRKGTPVVLTTGPILVKEHTHPLLLWERRPRLTEVSLIEMAVQEERVLQYWKARGRAKNGREENAQDRRLIYGTLPCACLQVWVWMQVSCQTHWGWWTSQ